MSISISSTRSETISLLYRGFASSKRPTVYTSGAIHSIMEPIRFSLSPYYTHSRPFSSSAYEGADHDSRVFDSSDLTDPEVFAEVWARLMATIEKDSFEDPYDAFRIAILKYNRKVGCIETDLIILSVMFLLSKYAYTLKHSFGKFHIVYRRTQAELDDVSFVISSAIIFRKDGIDPPVYSLIEKLIREKAEQYRDDLLGEP